MRFTTIASFALLAILIAVPVQADDSETGWHSTAEFGLVVTSGNSESQTISFKDETKRVWDKSSMTFKLGAIKAETTTTSRSAAGIPAVVTEIESTDVSAEAYWFSGRYDRKIHEKLFWFTGAGWDQNRPAGVDSRVTAFGGVGNIWRDDDKVKFRTDYALSYTDQEDVVPTASSVDSYAGLRASWAYKHQFTETTEYINDFVVDLGLDDSDNWRANMLNAVAVSINSKLALKFSLATLYNNKPPVELLVNPTPGGVNVEFELDELDTIASAALVINF